MSWATWEATWRLHAKSRAFAHSVETAKRLAREGAAKVAPRSNGVGGLFCALSGGKDSVAMAGILVEAGIDVPSVHTTTKLDYPDTLATVEAVAEHLNLELEVVEPANCEWHVEQVCRRFGVAKPQPPVDGYDELSILEAVPASATLPEMLDQYRRATASGNMGVAYTYEHEYAGSFCGLRSEESNARAMYRAVWGPVFQSRKDQTWRVCPLLGWSDLDVYAFIVDRGLPLHPWYRRAYEAQQGRVNPGTLRVDSCVPETSILGFGSWAVYRRVYREHAEMVERYIPLLKQYR